MYMCVVALCVCFSIFLADEMSQKEGGEEKIRNNYSFCVRLECFLPLPQQSSQRKRRAHRRARKVEKE